MTAVEWRAVGEEGWAVHARPRRLKLQGRVVSRLQELHEPRHDARRNDLLDRRGPFDAQQPGREEGGR